MQNIMSSTYTDRFIVNTTTQGTWSSQNENETNMKATICFSQHKIIFINSKVHKLYF